MTVTSRPLSPCQEKALKTLFHGMENVFLTGRAGSGKSFLIRHFLEKKDRKTFPVVASTGAAAVLVGGRTFHSFFGLGIMEGGAEETIKRALGEKRVVKRLRKIEGFVLDEVSMIPGPALKAAEAICRRTRKKDLLREDDVKKGFHLLLDSEAPVFESIVQGLAPKQISFLKALAVEPSASVFSMDYMKKHHLTSTGGIQGALKTLDKLDLIEKSDDAAWKIVDPLFRKWLVQNFMADPLPSFFGKEGLS